MWHKIQQKITVKIQKIKNKVLKIQKQKNEEISETKTRKGENFRKYDRKGVFKIGVKIKTNILQENISN